MDSERAKQIIESEDAIQVLYQDSPVWLESIGDNNVAKATRLDNNEKIEVPVYMLEERNPLNFY